MFSQFVQAVKYYAKSEQVLKDFGDHPSFSGIQSDCQEIVVTLRNLLNDQFTGAEVRNIYAFQTDYSYKSPLHLSARKKPYFISCFITSGRRLPLRNWKNLYLFYASLVNHQLFLLLSSLK